MKNFFELLQRRIWLGPLIALIIFVVGLGVGLVIGWETVSFKASADDVLAAADSYSLNSDIALANQRLASLSKAEKQALISTLIARANAANRPLEAQRLTALALALGVTPAPAAGGTPVPGATPAPQTTPVPTGSNTLLGMIVPIALIFIVFVLLVAAGLIFFLRVLPGLQTRRAPRGAPSAEVTAEPTWAGRVSPGAPLPAPPGGLGHFVPQYTLGNDNYDTSYSLETPRGEFLGECGMGISETIGEGKPDKVTAFDLWLFDKADVRTVTQILMSEYAYNDQTLRTKLATKGEAVLAEKGKTLHLETQSLSIAAQVVELIYAVNPSYPPNSHFQKLVVEIVPTIKDGAAR